MIDNFIGVYGEEIKITREILLICVKNIINNIIIFGLLKMVSLLDV